MAGYSHDLAFDGHRLTRPQLRAAVSIALHSAMPESASREESGFDEAYLSFARTLRTWFVAYGIGVPVLVLNQDKVLDLLVRSSQTLPIAKLFLAGVCVQVGTVIVYKAAMWHLYRAEFEPQVRQRLLFGFFNWISEAFWLELLLDLMTATLFAWGTIRMLRIVAV